MKTIKGLIKSKTFWFNLITGVLVFLNETNGKIVSSETSATIITAGNIILRFMTNKPLYKK